MPDSGTLGDTWKYDQGYHKMADFLGLDVHARQDYGLAQKVSLIRDWAGLKGKDDTDVSAMTALEKLKHTLGTNVQGKELINEFYQHIRLDMDRQRLQSDKTLAVQQFKGEEPKSRPKTPGVDVKKLVAGAVQQSVKGMVQGVLKDKKVMQQAITNAVAETFK